MQGVSNVADRGIILARSQTLDDLRRHVGVGAAAPAHRSLPLSPLAAEAKVDELHL